MKSLSYEQICKVLSERFGDPIYSTLNEEVDDDVCCNQCDMMIELDQEHSCSELKEVELDQKAPPGGEKVVKALKKDKNVDNPWAVAWAQYNKKKRK